MSRYRFRLETVLRVRRAEESDAKAALLLANARLRQALEVRDAAQRHYRDVIEAQDGTRTVEQLVRDRWEAGLCAEALAVAQRGAMRAAGEAALAQVDWSQAARRVAVLERLDERRRAEHAEEERRAEQGVVDDLVTARFATGAGVASAGAPGRAVEDGGPTGDGGTLPAEPARHDPEPVGAPRLRLVRSDGGEAAS